MATCSANRVEGAHELVVIVDDDASVRRSMDRLIRSFGDRTQVSARRTAQFDAVFAGANRLEAMIRSDCEPRETREGEAMKALAQIGQFRPRSHR